MFNLKTNPKRIILAIILSAVIFLLISFIIKNPGTPGKDKVCYKNYCFEVELAQTPEEMSQGLMSRESLDEYEGMLFIFDREGDYPFWMKNTLIPLDIIWINDNKEVVFISENTQPCKEDPCLSVNPDKNAEYVLEINGNTARKIGLNIGDKLDFKLSSCVLCDIN